MFFIVEYASIVEYARVKIRGCTAPPPRNVHNDVTPDNILILSCVFSMASQT